MDMEWNKRIIIEEEKKKEMEVKIKEKIIEMLDDIVDKEKI